MYTHTDARAPKVITVCTCAVSCVARDDDRPLRSIAVASSEARTPACAACDPRRVRHVRDYHVARSYLQRSSSHGDRVSLIASPRRASLDTRCVNRDASSPSSVRAARRCSASPDSCSFSREARSVARRQVVLQTGCYFSGGMEEAERETMRAMFFEKPVVAATAACEIGVFARPIGKKEPNSGSRRANPVSYARTRGRAVRSSPSIFLSDDVGGPGRGARARGHR